MPTYEYQCQACGHQLEAFQKITEAPLTDCPTCHQPSLSKLVSASNFQLKGTGWYATDFRDTGKAKPSNSESDTTSNIGGTETKTNETTSNSNDSSSNHSTAASS